MKWVKKAASREDNRAALQCVYAISLDGVWYHIAADGFRVHAERLACKPVEHYYYLDPDQGVYDPEENVNYIDVEGWLVKQPFHVLNKRRTESRLLMRVSGRDFFFLVAAAVAESHPTMGYQHLTLNWRRLDMIVGWKEDEDKSLRFVPLASSFVAADPPPPLNINPDLLFVALKGFYDADQVDVRYFAEENSLVLETPERFAIIASMNNPPYVPPDLPQS